MSSPIVLEASTLFQANSESWPSVFSIGDYSSLCYPLAKYIFVTGGVMSGIGKGVIAASIGEILQVRGLKVTAAKVEPYLNYDAGTMNPYIYREVLVKGDVRETDTGVGT